MVGTIDGEDENKGPAAATVDTGRDRTSVTGRDRTNAHAGMDSLSGIWKSRELMGQTTIREKEK